MKYRNMMMHRHSITSCHPTRTGSTLLSYSSAVLHVNVNVLLALLLLLAACIIPCSDAFSAIAPPSRVASLLGLPPQETEEQQQQLDDLFTVVDHTEANHCTVLKTPIRSNEQGNANANVDSTGSSSAPQQHYLYIAIDCSANFDAQTCPGNGGLRWLDYSTEDIAVADAVRLAQGMTRKHNVYRTGFSGAKLVATGHGTVHRVALMETTARALQALQGSVYTGCDLNTDGNDMETLVSLTNDRYVLAGMQSRVDTNIATAMTVIGALQGLCDAHDQDLTDLVCTVQGCGKVGTIVAEELVRRGVGTVQTCDLDSSRAAAIEGCTVVDNWATTPCHVLLPCANSLAITESIAQQLPSELQFCVGATNSPFATDEARRIVTDDKKVVFVPESISSAGAILADSVEWTDRSLFRSVQPALLYGWVREQSRAKASNLCRSAGMDSTKMHAIDTREKHRRVPAGSEFPEWIQENMIRTDTLIIGGGMAGTATARSLSRAGHETVLVEQGSSIAPATASSNGDSRMYRQLYSDPFFSQMQTDALKCWRDVQEETGTTLLHPNGLLFYGEDTGETVEGSVEGARKTMIQLGLPHIFYESGDALAKAFPALEGCKGKPYTGVYEESAGHVRASAACNAMLQSAGESCDLHLSSKVVELATNGGGYDNAKVMAVTTEGKTISADHVVLCAGPWTNEVLKEADLAPLDLEVWRIQWAHYRVDDPEVAKTIPQAFHFRKEDGIDGGLYYVFPASATESMDSPEGGPSYVKVGVDFPTGMALENMGEFEYDGNSDVLRLIDGWVAEHLPGVGERVNEYTSPYTMTPDSTFVMDRLSPNVAIFTGGSGRAFKFGPLIGDCLAALVTGEEPPIDLTRFSSQRDSVKTTASS